MNKEEFLNELVASEDAPNTSIIYDLVKTKVEEMKKEIIQMVGNDIGVLDRALSRVEDKINNAQNQIYDLSYTIKQLQN